MKVEVQTQRERTNTTAAAQANKQPSFDGASNVAQSSIQKQFTTVERNTMS